MSGIFCFRNLQICTMPPPRLFPQTVARLPSWGAHCRSCFVFEPVGRVTQSMGEKAWVTNRKRIMSVGIAVDSSVKGMMRSKFPTIIPSFLVLNIPMNLPQSRNRVRQRAPRFREFHLHSTKRTSSSLVGARWDIRFLRQFVEKMRKKLNKRCHSKEWVACFVLKFYSAADKMRNNYICIVYEIQWCKSIKSVNIS